MRSREANCRSESVQAHASLRKLAARLGIAQPSLYHYFRTKEDLVEEVLATYAGKMFSVLQPEDLPKRLEDVPRIVVQTILRVYAQPTHPLFVRVAISVSRSHERFGTLMRRVFIERANFGIQEVMRPFVEREEIGADDALDLVRMLINAVGLRLIEDTVMFDQREPGPDFERYAQFVIDAGETQLRELRRRASES